MNFATSAIEAEILRIRSSNPWVTLDIPATALIPTFVRGDVYQIHENF